jgi:hypothetical protein
MVVSVSLEEEMAFAMEMPANRLASLRSDRMIGAPSEVEIIRRNASCKPDKGQGNGARCSESQHFKIDTSLATASAAPA